MEPATTSQEEAPLEKEDWTGAARMAAECRAFQPDEEEEQIADEARSCYNCRYRRWTATYFSCIKRYLKGS